MSADNRDLIPEQAWAILISEPTVDEYVRAAEIIVAAELERLADEMARSSKHMPVTADDVRARAAELRGDRKEGQR